ncbi:unnamed protein product [Bemisia tabaci]|uniref:Uncharacterized protein n=1 Tax=Bemisia tabaci TaxID=7038 RepID=A0A9P0C783_BEMTA|nr:unnamed protein product [Bemisia tabaci]
MYFPIHCIATLYSLTHFSLCNYHVSFNIFYCKSKICHITYNRNFAPLCAMLDSLGTFQIDGHTFNPVVPKSQLQIVLIGEDTLEVDGVAPDPYLVTLSNLRDTVVFLSNGNTPVQYRKYFHERNPLPGARWTNQHRLLNPDQIIPPGYSNADLLNDLRKLRDYADCRPPVV